VNGTTSRDEKGVPIKVVGAFIDIEKKQKEQEIEALLTK